MKQKVKKFDAGDFVTLDSPFAQSYAVGASSPYESDPAIDIGFYNDFINSYGLGNELSQTAFEQAAQADVDSNWFSDFAESLLPGDMTYEDLAQYAEYGGEITKGLGAGVTQMGAGVLTGLAELLPEEYEESVQTGIGDFAEQIIADYLAPGEGYEDSALRTYSEAVGTTIPYLIPGGAVVRGAQVAAGMAGQAGEAATRAIAAGATPEEKNEATTLASVMGAFETVLGPGKAIDRLIPGQAGQEFVTDIAEVVF